MTSAHTRPDAEPPTEAAPAIPSWAPGTATGLGSLPGTEIAEALRVVLGELPDLPHIPELPDRGPGAEMIGRTAALLTDMPTEIAPKGWQLADHVSRDLRRARDYLARDLDTVVELSEGINAFKIQAAGPWTMAAQIELWNGSAVLSDRGARRDLAESLADGLRLHVADIRRRLPPGARVVLQLDEPSLPAVLLGRIHTPSGLGTISAVDNPDAITMLQNVFAAAGADATVLHCCAAEPPIAMMAGTGVTAVSIDIVSWAQTTGHTKELDALGELVESGQALWLGVLPSIDTAGVTADLALSRMRAIWNRLGFTPSAAQRTIVATPSCGLADATPGYVRHVLRAVTKASRQLTEDD